jgi:hypothetical protein
MCQYYHSKDKKYIIPCVILIDGKFTSIGTACFEYIDTTNQLTIIPVEIRRTCIRFNDSDFVKLQHFSDFVKSKKITPYDTTYAITFSFYDYSYRKKYTMKSVPFNKLTEEFDNVLSIDNIAGKDDEYQYYWYMGDLIQRYNLKQPRTPIFYGEEP